MSAFEITKQSIGSHARITFLIMNKFAENAIDGNTVNANPREQHFNSSTATKNHLSTATFVWYYQNLISYLIFILIIFVFLINVQEENNVLP